MKSILPGSIVFSRDIKLEDAAFYQRIEQIDKLDSIRLARVKSAKLRAEVIERLETLIEVSSII